MQAHIRKLASGRRPEPQAPMSLVDNTSAAVAALFLRRELDGPWLQVLLRERPEVAHPVTRKAVRRPPAAILTQGSRPVAVLIGELLVVSRTAARCLRVPLVREARSQGLDCVQVRDPQLVKLASDYAVSAADAALGAQCASASGGLSRR